MDVTISVLQSNGGMGSVLLENAERLNINNISSYINDKIKQIRKDNEMISSGNFLVKLPWPIRKWFFNLYRFITLKWGISIPFSGLSANTFGSFVLTNIGSIGIDKGYPGLMPSSNVAFVFVMGSSQKKPVVLNDEIVVRKIMTVSMVIDHRLADASHAGILLKYIKNALKHPTDYFEKM